MDIWKCDQCWSSDCKPTFTVRGASKYLIESTNDTQSGVNFIKCFAPFTYLLRPAPNFYTTKNISKVGHKVRTVLRRVKTGLRNQPLICLCLAPWAQNAKTSKRVRHDKSSVCNYSQPKNGKSLFYQRTSTRPARLHIRTIIKSWL